MSGSPRRDAGGGISPLHATGIVDSAVCQPTVDYSDEFAPGYHVILGNGRVVTGELGSGEPLTYIAGRLGFTDT